MARKPARKAPRPKPRATRKQPPPKRRLATRRKRKRSNAAASFRWSARFSLSQRTLKRELQPVDGELVSHRGVGESGRRVRAHLAQRGIFGRGRTGSLWFCSLANRK